MKYFKFLTFICAILICEPASAERVILLKEQISGVMSMDGKYKFSIVIYANAMIITNNNESNVKITAPKMNMIVMNVTSGNSWETSVGKVPMPDGKFMNIKIEDVVAVKKSENIVEINIDYNGFKKIIISEENFIKLNDAIAKNKDIPSKINDSWLNLVEDWE